MSRLLRDNIHSIITLTDEEFEFVRSHFLAKHFRKHQLMVQEGNYVTHDYFIEEGLTKTFSINEEGKEHVLDFAMDGYWVTDVQALQQQTKASLNVYCLKDCHTLSISYDNIEKLCAGLTKMQYYFRKKAIQQNIQLQRRILCLIKNNAADRYHDLIENYPDLIQKVPKTLIASYVGVSRETLSRMLLK